MVRRASVAWFLLAAGIAGTCAPAFAEGFGSKAELQKAATEAVESRDVKKFVALYPFGTADGSFADGIKKRAKVLMDAGVEKVYFTMVWPENSEMIQEHIGYLNFVLKTTDGGVSTAYPFGRMRGKYYLVLMTEHALKAENDKKADDARRAAEAAAAAARPAPQPTPAPRSTGLTHRVVLKNGQSMDVAIVQKDAKGMWVEMAPGARTYVKNSEVMEVDGLNGPPRAVEAAEPPPASEPVPARAPAPTPAPVVPEAGPVEGQALFDAATAALDTKDEAKFVALLSTENADPEMVSMSKSMMAGIVQQGVTRAEIVPAKPSDNDPRDHNGYRYRPALPIVGEIKFYLKDQPGNMSMSIPFARKDGGHVFVTSSKEKI